MFGGSFDAYFSVHWEALLQAAHSPSFFVNALIPPAHTQWDSVACFEGTVYPL
jgi:hypothetical protein